MTVLGAGTIGASWCALFLAKGLDVGPDSVQALFASSKGLGRHSPNSASRPTPRCLVCVMFRTCPKPAGDRLRAGVRAGTRNLKVALFEKVDSLIWPDVLIASSSSALTVSEMQKRCRHPERVVLGHPFNPPHIMPLVEVAGGAKRRPMRWVARQRSMQRSASRRSASTRK